MNYRRQLWISYRMPTPNDLSRESIGRLLLTCLNFTRTPSQRLNWNASGVKNWCATPLFVRSILWISAICPPIFLWPWPLTILSCLARSFKFCKKSVTHNLNSKTLDTRFLCAISRPPLLPQRNSWWIGFNRLSKSGSFFLAEHVCKKHPGWSRPNTVNPGVAWQWTKRTSTKSCWPALLVTTVGLFVTWSTPTLDWRSWNKGKYRLNVSTTHPLKFCIWSGIYFVMCYLVDLCVCVWRLGGLICLLVRFFNKTPMHSKQNINRDWKETLN